MLYHGATPPAPHLLQITAGAQEIRRQERTQEAEEKLMMGGDGLENQGNGTESMQCSEVGMLRNQLCHQNCRQEKAKLK